jgi:hypothetical protein
MGSISIARKYDFYYLENWAQFVILFETQVLPMTVLFLMDWPNELPIKPETAILACDSLCIDMTVVSLQGSLLQIGE